MNKRKQTRLKNYDYSQVGKYFITICTKDNKQILWQRDIGDQLTISKSTAYVGATYGRPIDENRLSKIGLIVDNEVQKINEIYGEKIIVDKYVVMPNHIHMILSIEHDVEGRPKVAPTISRVVQQFKGSISKKVGDSIWQKSFHDHVIRNQKSYDEIWGYIEQNPQKWELDKYYTRL